SAVWVLLECGDRKKDEAAARVLEEHLPVMEKTLRLPEAVDRENLEGLSRLRVGFPLIRLSRLEMREEVFIRMLMNTEPDLDLYADWPMAFPVYGRGRTLYALVGEGITAENIEEACAFLTGPCACEIKDLNPGMDLLMAVDWQSGLGGSWVAEVDIPPLTGLSGLSQAPAAEVAAGAGPGGNPLWRNILLAIGLVAALVLLSTIVVLKTGKRR
ncbi:MAG: hypothetical protein U9P14_00415, partial [Gemmatimonadota bacterium]|nr:hypothetical protein [Gemmatimonadota bacterium]